MIGQVIGAVVVVVVIVSLVLNVVDTLHSDEQVRTYENRAKRDLGQFWIEP